MKTFRSLLLLTLLFPLVSFAQGLPGISNPVTIDMSPVSPGPGDTVTLTAQSSSFDVNSVVLTWKSGTKIISTGTGNKTIKIPAGAIGNKTSITLSAQVPSLGTFTSAVSIDPALVNLVWEAQTSVPPFYQGKALLGWGATYKIVALPQVSENGAVVNPSRLVYKWSKNYSVDPNQSGYGKNVYQSDGSVNYTNGGDIVSLTVSTADGIASAKGTISVSPVNSALLTYMESPLYGVMYNQTVAQTTLSGNTLTLHSEPFFFSNVAQVVGSLTWNMNGSDVPSFTGKQSITLVRQDKNAGTSVVEAKVQNPSEMLQGATGNVTININAAK